ncbi:MAG: methylmalonyl-CoA epimerase [Candidatus Aminicenantes bacterium]|nr:methylmalonyl-CoA epimerase [Candidatus Aminicenantes bacterium]
MIIKKLDHIGIAVKDLESSLEKWAEAFAFEKSDPESLPDRGVRVAYLFPKKGPTIELVTPLGEESPVKKFLESRGEGIHHLCFRVKNLKKLMAHFQERGISFLTEEPVRGAGGSRIIFIHPKFFNGVLIEFKEKEDNKEEIIGKEEREKE